MAASRHQRSGEGDPGLLRELKIYRDAPNGQTSRATRAAIREYQRMAGLKETGEPSKALFESLKEKCAR